MHVIHSFIQQISVESPHARHRARHRVSREHTKSLPPGIQETQSTRHTRDRRECEEMVTAMKENKAGKKDRVSERGTAGTTEMVVEASPSR